MRRTLPVIILLFTCTAVYCQHHVSLNKGNTPLIMAKPILTKQVTPHAALAQTIISRPEKHLANLPAPQITAAQAAFCPGGTALLSVNVPANHPTYSITWYFNGAILSADQNLVTIAVANPGNYMVTVTDITSAFTESSPIFDLEYTGLLATVTNFVPEARICSSAQLIFLNVQNAPFNVRWYTNGILNGNVSDTLLVTQTGKYRVEVSDCSGRWLSSNVIQIDVVTLPTPVVTADKPVYCAGDRARLSVNVPADTSYTINWYRSGTLLPTYKNLSSLTTDTAGDYSVQIVNNAVNYDGSYCTSGSAAVPVVFNPLPTLTIQKISKTTLCAGQTVNLIAQYSAGSLKWSTGETTDQIVVSKAGNYTATVTSPAGCITDTTIAISMVQNPILHVNDTTVCFYKNQNITIAAPAGFAQYSWNDIPGQQTFVSAGPQTVSLTVTDANGCQATQQIHIIEDCPEVNIPNTFTPNNDGINDTWDISGLNGDATATVKIFTRYGTQVYDSRGYYTPWNGAFNDKKLPSGTYYYVITIRNGKQRFSGWVLILY